MTEPMRPRVPDRVVATWCLMHGPYKTFVEEILHDFALDLRDARAESNVWEMAVDAEGTARVRAEAERERLQRDLEIMTRTAATQGDRASKAEAEAERLRAMLQDGHDRSICWQAQEFLRAEAAKGAKP